MRWKHVWITLTVVSLSALPFSGCSACGQAVNVKSASTEMPVESASDTASDSERKNIYENSSEERITGADAKAESAAQGASKNTNAGSSENTSPGSSGGNTQRVTFSSSFSESTGNAAGSAGSTQSGTSGSAESSSSGNASTGNTSNGRSSSGRASGGTSTTPAAHTHAWVPITKTVHHDATGHWETVVVTPAWDETVVVSEAWDEPVYEIHWFCDACGMDFTAEGVADNDYINKHMLAHMYAGESSRTYNKQVQTGTIPHEAVIQTVYHDAVAEQQWVQDTAAYDETVTEGERCFACGATREVK